MSRRLGIGGSQALVWAAVYLPLGFQTWSYFAGSAFYGEYLHWTGDWAVRLLILTLAVTPLRLAFPGAGWARWLLRRRRDLGVACAAYAMTHTLAYLIRKGDWRVILEDALSAGMLTGWLAMGIFLLLAITSNNGSVRRLGRRWKSLHRSVHLAAALTFAHWLLTAFDPTAGWVHGGVLAALMVLRVVLTARPRRRPMAH